MSLHHLKVQKMILLLDLFLLKLLVQKRFVVNCLFYYTYKRHNKTTWGHNKKWWPGDLRIYTMYIICLRFHKNVVRKFTICFLVCLYSFTNMVQEVAPSHLLLPLQHDIYGEDVHSRHFMCLNLLLHKRNVKKLLLS